MCKDDYRRFMGLLYLCNNDRPIHIYRRKKLQYRDYFEVTKDDELVRIGAYCLMPNHFHILISERNDGNISKFMQKITTAYTMYFNKKYARTGSLFENTFKSNYAEDDRYLKYLFSYIHLNPVKILYPEWKTLGIKDIKNVEEFLQNYPYSSFIDYKNLSRFESVILEKSAFPDYFTNQTEFLASINDFLNLAPRFSLGD